ncbi:MAG: hypothetical protein R2827_05980 [Bdellovibrionales bacterium]
MVVLGGLGTSVASLIFTLELKSSNRVEVKLLSVEQLKIDSEGQEPVARVTANGTGIFQNNGKQINAVMRSVTFENENSRTTNIYWLYFHSFCSPNSESKPIC